MNTARLTGAIDRVDRSALRGWIFDGADPAAIVQVELLVDGVPSGIVAANRPRPDLASLNIGRTDLGFELPLPAGTPYDTKRIAVRVVGTELAIPWLKNAPAFEGVLETVLARRVMGWAWQFGQTDVRPWILIEHGDKLVSRIQASGYRQDLVGAGLGDGKYGFDFALPPGQPGLDPAKVSARFEADGGSLYDMRAPSRPPAPPKPAPAPMKQPTPSQTQVIAPPPVSQAPRPEPAGVQKSTPTPAVNPAKTEPAPLQPQPPQPEPPKLSPELMAALLSSLSSEGESLL
jgi:hypothetical protein